MKKLILLRHSKTEESYTGQKDFDRELTTQGISDSIHKGQIIKHRNLQFDLMISSSSKRTMKTSQLVAEQVGYTLRNIQNSEELYLASTRTMLDVINSIDNNVGTLLIVAHNPGTSYISEYLTGESIGHVSTSGALQIEFEVDDWQLISENTGQLIWTDFTKS